MPGPARAGLFIYAKDLDRLARFSESLRGMTRLHATDELVVLESQQTQLVVHRIPPHVASGIVMESPPVRQSG